MLDTTLGTLPTRNESIGRGSCIMPCECGLQDNYDADYLEYQSRKRKKTGVSVKLEFLTH